MSICRTLRPCILASPCITELCYTGILHRCCWARLHPPDNISAQWQSTLLPLPCLPL